MRSKTIMTIFITLALVSLAAIAAVPAIALLGVSAITIAGSEGTQPTAVVESNTSAGGYQPVRIDELRVEVGVGSPIPVFAIVKGQLPDGCSQVEYMQQHQDGASFIFSLSSVAVASGACSTGPQAFEISLPINVTNLPAGTYLVEVNGSQTSFELKNNITGHELRTADMPISKDDIHVSEVRLELNGDQPSQAIAVVAMDLPGSCSQLGEMRLHRDGSTFYVQLLAYLPAEVDCGQDTLPFVMRVPLNTADQPEATYKVIVNGMQAEFESGAAQ